MAYVKTVLGAGDEYEHDLTAADLAAGIHSDIDALTHADYGLSIRLATAKRWTKSALFGIPERGTSRQRLPAHGLLPPWI